jgi:hypothetical protein
VVVFVVSLSVLWILIIIIIIYEQRVDLKFASEWPDLVVQIRVFGSVDICVDDDT